MNKQFMKILSTAIASAMVISITFLAMYAILFLFLAEHITESEIIEYAFNATCSWHFMRAIYFLSK